MSNLCRKGHPRECNIQLWNCSLGSFEWKTYSSKPCKLPFVSFFFPFILLSIGILIAFIDLKKNRIENFLYLQALDLIRGKSVLCLMDSSLEGQYENDDATKMVELASKCLQSEARDRPDAKFLLTAVAPLQKQKEVIMSFFFCSLP